MSEQARRVDSPGAGKIPVHDPRTGRIEFWMPVETPAQVAVKAKALRAAQRDWGAMRVEDRIAVLQRWAEAIERHRDAIIAADSKDTGYGQISRIAPDMMLGTIRGLSMSAPAAFAAATRQGRSHAMPHVSYDSVLKPYPLIGVISPWNAPTMLSMLRAIPPLFAGCSVLVKPSEVTPRFVEPLRATLADVPELQAVFDFALGDGSTGAALIEVVDFISFTGSVPNGKRVAEACARRLIPCELELGGKDPAVITASANLDDAASAVLRGAVTSTGQVCFSIERVYVERSVHDELVARLAAKAERVAINHPDPDSGHIGPFITARQAEIVDKQIDEAVAMGARIVTGGKSFLLDGGRYMRATVITNVTHKMALMRDETFGPVIPVMAWDSVDEAVALANDTYFGLSAAVLAGSEEEARAIASRIDAGNVSVQDAFLTFAAAPAEADAFNSSGIGGKRSGIQRYLRRQALLINSRRPECMLDEPLKAAR